MTSPVDPHSKTFSHINGSVEELLDRLAVEQLCKGWPVYRDASEWKNFRSLFTDDATVWTTWSGPKHIDDFIAVSKAGKASGVFIMHRECGTLAELSRDRARAVGKMKATITQRFADGDGTAFDIDCDCQFFFFCEKVPVVVEAAAVEVNGTGKGTEEEGVETNGCQSAEAGEKGEHVMVENEVNGTEKEKETEKGNEKQKDIPDEKDKHPAWKARFAKLIYAKDKVVPVDGRAAPRLTSEEMLEMESYPEGYRYLGVMQRRLGYRVDRSLATPRNAGWGKMYRAMEEWLDGAETVDL